MTVWIFHATGAPFASGVFAGRDEGLAWIARHHLSGILTEYPVGDGCYDLAVRDGSFRPGEPHHGTPEHVGRFAPAGAHVHVKAGAEDDHYGEN